MNIRFHGGPNHNKTMMIDPHQPTNSIVIDGYDTRKIARGADPYDYWNCGLSAPTKKGSYWRTGVTDKVGNIVFAWAGWR